MDKIEKCSYLPRQYYDTLQKVISLLKEQFQDNLLSVTLGGSGGKNQIIEGWSDLDLYVILVHMDLKGMSIILEMLQKYSVHIGITYYTKNEVKQNRIDRKTKIMIYEKKNFHFNPTIYGDDLFQNISYQEIQKNDIEQLPNILHVFRRITCSCISDVNNVTQKYVKKLFVLLKCYLTTQNMFGYGYENTLKSFSELYNSKMNQKLEFNFLECVHSFTTSREIILDFAIKILEYISMMLEEER